MTEVNCSNSQLPSHAYPLNITPVAWMEHFFPTNKLQWETVLLEVTADYGMYVIFCHIAVFEGGRGAQNGFCLRN